MRALRVARTGQPFRRESDLKLLLRTWPSVYCNVSALASALLGFIFFCLLLRCAGKGSLPLPAAPTSPQFPPLGRCAPSTPPREFLVQRNAVVAADNAACSVVGRDVLQSNGSAVDAAIATALCLGVVHPHSSGIGGGCFILVYNGTSGASEVIDARETAPALANESMFRNNTDASLFGGLAVAVPGELAGLRLAWERFGRLPWSRLVEPAAALADGFLVSQQLELAISANLKEIRRNAGLSTLLCPNGVPLRQNDTLANPALAATLRDVARRGPGAAIYSGAAAERLASEVRGAGGVLTASDLAAYRPVVRAPLRSSALGYTILGAPPPSSGGVAVALVAAFLGSYDQPLAGVGAGLAAHRTTEAFKHAFAARMALGDPMDPFVGNNTDEVADMTSADFAALLRNATRDRETQQPSAYGGRWNPLPGGGGFVPDDHGTTHLSVVRRNGFTFDAVSITSTINTAFGSKLVSPSSGILLNNQMDDFSSPGQVNTYNLAPSRANYIRPGKRPLSSMSPTIVLSKDGLVRAVLGASGGPRIISATSQVLLNLLANGLSPMEAVRAPRLHHQLLPNVAMVEETAAPDGLCVSVSKTVRDALLGRRHAVNATTAGAVVQLVAVNPDTWLLEAVSDARKGGVPAGY